MTWSEWLNSEYKTDEYGGYFYNEGTLINYRTHLGYDEGGFNIDSLDTIIINDTHLIGYSDEEIISFEIINFNAINKTYYASKNMTWREWYNSSFAQDAIPGDDSIWGFQNLELIENTEGYWEYSYFWRHTYVGGDGGALCKKGTCINSDNDNYTCYIILNIDKQIIENMTYYEEYSTNFNDI